MIVSLLRSAVLERLLLSVSDQSGRKTRGGRKLTKNLHTPPAQKSLSNFLSCPAGLDTEGFFDGACLAMPLQVLSSFVLSKEITCENTEQFNL